MREWPITLDVAVGDTLTPWAFKATRPGTETAVDLTGLTGKVYAVDEDGAEAIAETATGVTITDEAEGEFQYDRQEADVATARRLYLYFRFYDGDDERERFPTKAEQLIVNVHGDTE